MSSSVGNLLRRAAGTDEPGIPFNRIWRRSRQIRTRRIAVFGVTGTAASLILGTALWSAVPQLLDGTNDGAPAMKPAAPAEPETPPNCAPPAAGYQPVLVPQSGPPGTSVTADGPIPLFGQDGQYIPTSKVSLWWNLDPDAWPSALTSSPSPAESDRVVSLGHTNASGQCEWVIQFEVPDFPPGTYNVVGLHHGRDPREAASFPLTTFEVTP